MSAADEVMNNWQALVTRIQGAQTDKAITDMMITTQLYSAPMTPVDTSNLINSQFRELEQNIGGMTGTVGYSAEYAAAVHEMPGKLRGQPRADFGMTGNQSEFGPVQRVAFGGGSGTGNYWDGGNGPDSGEPKFLEKGRDEMIKYDYEQIVKEAYKL